MIPAPPHRTTTVWPLADLFDALRRNGFQLRPDDYTEVVQVLDTFQPQSYDDLRALIAPLLVTSEEEQVKFDRIFEQVRQTEKIIPHTVTKKRLPWQWLAATLLALLAVGYIAFFWPGPAFKTDMHLFGPVGPFETGDTLLFSVDSSMQKAAGPLARWQWETPDGRLYPNAHAPTLRVPARSAGPLVVNLRSQHGRGLLATTWTDSIQRSSYPICDKLPVVQLDSVRLSSVPLRYRFKARLTGTITTVQRMQWQLNGGVVASNRMEWEHTFQSGTVPAFYNIRFEALTDTTNRLCFGDAQLMVGVAPVEEPPFTLDVQATGSPFVPQMKSNQTLVWLSMAVGVLLLTLLGIYGWLVIRKPKVEPSVPSPDDNPLARFTSDEPPLDIPLENRETELITLDQPFYRLVQTLRRPAEGEIRRLSIAQTMRATMQEGGFPTLVFQPHLAETAYLFLIDRTEVRSQQVALFEYLFRVFTQENVCVERFFFHRTFQLFTNETHRKGLTLRQLADSYQGQTLVIWGTGYPLLSAPYPIVEPAIRDALADWPSKAILTPVPFADWSSKERALQTDFLLLPADMPGQLRLMQALAEQQIQQDAYLQRQIKDLYSTQNIDFEEPDELADYLGDDLFQWLAAMAIYPRIRWEIVLELGWALLPSEAVNFTNLLKLARISWMHEGRFPDYTRLELLKRLYPENEVIARQRLLQMLTFSEQYFPGEHFYDGEKYLLQTVNQFALYAHDADTFADYQPAQQAFKKLYEQRLYPDGAVLHYLENPDGDWTTLLPPVHTSVPGKAIKSGAGRPRTPGLRDYFDKLPDPTVKETPKPPADKRKQYLLAGIAVAILAFVGLFYLNNQPWGKEIDWNQRVPVTIVLDTTACATVSTTPVSKQGISRQARWAVFLNDTLYSLTNLRATKSFSLRDLVANRANTSGDSVDLQATVFVADATAGSGRQFSSVQLTGDTVRIRVNCPEQKMPVPDGEPVQQSPKPELVRKVPVPAKNTPETRLRVTLAYTNPAGPEFNKLRAYMKVLASNRNYRFVPYTKPVTYTGTSEVRYFRAVDRAAAQALAAQASKALGIPVAVKSNEDGVPCPPRCRDENDEMYTHLEIYINNGVAAKQTTCQPVPLTWISQFNGWQEQGSKGPAASISASEKGLDIREPSPDNSNATSAGGAIPSIESICQLNGVYVVSLYSRAGRTALFRNVTGNGCDLAFVNLYSRQIDGSDGGTDGAAFLSGLLKSTSFRRFVPVRGVARNVPDSVKTAPTIRPYEQQSQPAVNPAVQQTAKPEGAYTNNVNQLAVPAQTSMENLRINAQKTKDKTLQSGIDAYRRGQYAVAIELYDQFLAKNPANAYALTMKGYSLFKLERYDEALTTLLMATKANSSYAWAYTDLARVYCALGQSGAAADARRRAIQIQPSMQSIMEQDSDFMRLCGTGATAK